MLHIYICPLYHRYFQPLPSRYRTRVEEPLVHLAGSQDKAKPRRDIILYKHPESNILHCLGVVVGLCRAILGTCVCLITPWCPHYLKLPYFISSLIHFVLCGFHSVHYCVFYPRINTGPSNQYHFVPPIAYMNARFSWKSWCLTYFSHVVFMFSLLT